MKKFEVYESKRVNDVITNTFKKLDDIQSQLNDVVQHVEKEAYKVLFDINCKITDLKENLRQQIN